MALCTLPAAVDSLLAARPLVAPGGPLSPQPAHRSTQRPREPALHHCLRSYTGGDDNTDDNNTDDVDDDYEDSAADRDVGETSNSDSDDPDDLHAPMQTQTYADGDDPDDSQNDDDDQVDDDEEQDNDEEDDNSDDDDDDDDDEDDDLDPSLQQEIDEFYQTFPASQSFTSLTRSAKACAASMSVCLPACLTFGALHTGTFSSVYKAIDVKHYNYKNQWCLDHIPADARARSLASRDTISALRIARKSNCSIVALKRIYTTSSPARIYNELNILKLLSGHPNIAPIITVVRKDDHVIAVMRYFAHDEFRTFYRDLSVHEIKNYMRAILSALEHVHALKLIHRDIKPSNFLFSRASGTGVLVDFGLAQQEDRRPNRGKGAEDTVAPPLQKKRRIGQFISDPRPAVRASRAGTRGFRAPEVLFKVVNQTCAIDIWSVGVILLSIVAGKFPFFQSCSDEDALLEVAHIFGLEAMRQVAASFHQRAKHRQPHPMRDLVLRFGEGREDILDDDGYDFLDRLLTLDPVHRITASEALRHPFLAVPAGDSQDDPGTPASQPPVAACR
ncbi:kinase-like domain-containing protein [Entophlyctis helioformis]|nr:kinase-like domain-containing protein [Entophlyctis helioformis]